MCWKFALKCQLHHNLGSTVSTTLWWSCSWSTMMVHFSKSWRICQDVISEVSLAPLPNPNHDSSSSRWCKVTFWFTNWRSLNPVNISKRPLWITWYAATNSKNKGPLSQYFPRYLVITFPSGQPNFEWLRMLFQLLRVVVISLGVITSLVSGPSVAENPLEFEWIFYESKSSTFTAYIGSFSDFNFLVDAKCKMLYRSPGCLNFFF